MAGMRQLVWDDIKFQEIQWDKLISKFHNGWDSG